MKTLAIRAGQLRFPVTVTAAGASASRSSAASILVLTIAAAPVIWLLGASVIAYHLAAFVALVTTLLSRRSQRVRVGSIEVLLCGYLFLYTLSLSFNVTAAEPDRLLASAYNLSLWIIGAAMVFVGRNISDETFIEVHGRALTWLLAFILLATFYAFGAWLSGYDHVVLHPLTHFLFPIPVQLDGNDLFSASVRLNVIIRDWLLETTLPRLSVLAPYPVALAGLMLCCVPLALARCFDGLRRSLTAAAISILALVPFAWTLSRVALASLILASIIVLSARYLHFSIVTLSVSAITLLLSFMFVTYLYDFLWLREASTSYRFEMYQQALQTTLEESPLIGLGVKPRVSTFTIPLGSHSTYLGAFTKTGTLGALMLTMVTLRIACRALLVATRTTSPAHVALGISVIAILFWMATEDIDAPQLVAFLFWLHVGLLERLYPVGVGPATAGQLGPHGAGPPVAVSFATPPPLAPAAATCSPIVGALRPPSADPSRS